MQLGTLQDLYRTQPEADRLAKDKYACQIKETADGRRRRIGCEARKALKV
jgi:hypothetical protein